MEPILPVHEEGIPSDERCSLCGALRVGDLTDHHTEGEVADFVQWFADLERRDFLSAIIVLLLVRNPHLSYAEISRYLTERFGTIHRMTSDAVRSRIRRLADESETLESFLGRRRRAVRGQAKRRRRVTYGDERNETE